MTNITLTFDTKVSDVIDKQVTTSRRGYSGQFVDYTSKVKLLGANVLNDEQTRYITQLKHCFTFALHVSQRYLAITFYYSQTQTYAFGVMDLQTFKIAYTDSIRNAKQGILQLVQRDKQTIVNVNETGVDVYKRK